MTPDAVTKHLQFLQGVVNHVAARMTDCLTDADKATLALIQKELTDWKPSSFKAAAKQLEELNRKIQKLRSPAFTNAKTILLDEAREVFTFSADAAANEIEQTLEEAWQASKDNDLAIRRKLFDSTISPKKIDEILDYAPFSSGPKQSDTISGWFKIWERNDLHRVTSLIQKEMVEGLDLGKVMRQLRGWKDRSGVQHDGIFEISRESARTVSRTLINGVANAGRMEMYEQNADVIDGVKWLATLDTRSCLQCAALDGRIWPPDEMDSVIRPPAHPNCRCAVIPYIHLSEKFQGNRPAEVKDFDKDAEERYNREQEEREQKLAKAGKPVAPDDQKRWDDLSYETRKKKRYEAIREYEKENGEGTAYRQVKSSTDFKEYFETLDDKDKKEWLGASRYAAYQTGALNIDTLINPDDGYVRSVKDLEDMGIIPSKVDGIKPAIVAERNRPDADKVEPTGAALEYVTKNQEREEKHLTFLDEINQRLQDIDQSQMTEKEREKAINELQKGLNEEQTKHAKETLEALFGKPTENRSFDIEYESRDYSGNKKPSERDRNAVKKVVEDAVQYVQGVLDDIGVEYADKEHLSVFTQRDGAGNAQARGKILIGLKPKGGIDGMSLRLNPFEGVVHEIVHQVVQDNPQLRRKLKAFVNEHSPQLTKWQDNEKALYWKLNIPMPSYYCTHIKSTEDDYPEELLSMFFTCLISDTSMRHDMDAVVRTGSEFASKFPDYFNGIMSILRGLKK